MMGIILVAGRGSRMCAMTADRPKCLTVLAGQTLLSWQMKALSAAGVSEIVLVRGYAGDRLPTTGCQAVDNPRWADTNMVASLCCAARYLAAGPCTACGAFSPRMATLLSPMTDCGRGYGRTVSTIPWMMLNPFASRAGDS